MKQNRLFKTLLFSLALSFAAAKADAQRIYVTVRPTEPVVVKPAAPRADYIWVDGEWVASGRTYVWKPGYWVEPRRGYVWVRGHWIERGRRGSYWIPGHWARA